MVRRPVSVTVLALCNLLFGGLFLVCGVASIGTPEVSENGKNLTQDYQEYKEREIPAYRFMTFVEVGLKLVLAIGFIVAGVGMLQARAWGRLCALGSSGLVILHEVIKVVYELTLVNPAIKKYPHRFVGSFLSLGTWFIVVWALIATLFGVAQLALLLMPGMGRGFREGFPEEVDDKEAWLRRRWPARRDEDEDEDDEEDAPPRRPARKVRREEDIQPPPRRKPRPRPRDEEDE